MLKVGDGITMTCPVPSQEGPMIPGNTQGTVICKVPGSNNTWEAAFAIDATLPSGPERRIIVTAIVSVDNVHQAVFT